MRSTMVSRGSGLLRRVRGVLAGFALVALFALTAAPTTEAHPRGHGHGRHHGHGHGHGRGHFVVPRHIQGHGAYYNTYYHGRVYYGPHRHRHAVYHFPVYRSHRWVYEPYHYCGGQLFHSGYGGPHGYVSYGGPRLSVGVAF